MTDGGYTQTEAWNLQLQARVDRLEAAMKEVEMEAISDFEKELLQARVDRLEAAMKEVEMEAISDFEKELLQSAKELNTVLRRNVPAPTYMYGDLGAEEEWTIPAAVSDQIATLEENLSLRTKELNKLLRRNVELRAAIYRMLGADEVGDGRRNVKLRAAIYRMLGADEVGDGEAFEQALNHLKEVVKSNVT
jgi:hypothetical protein